MNRDKMSILYRGHSIVAFHQVSVHLVKWFQRRRLFRNQPIRNKNCLWWLCLLTDQDEMSKSLQRTFHRCFLPSFDSFGLAISEEKIFQKSTNRKQEWPVAAMFVNRSGRNQQSLQRTFQVFSFGHAVSEEKIFKNRPIRNKNGLWWPCLLMSIDASYQVSLHLAAGFQRRRLKCEKLTDDGRQVMAKAHIAFDKVN